MAGSYKQQKLKFDTNHVVLWIPISISRRLDYLPDHQPVLHDVLMKRISLIKPFDPYGLKFKLIIETAKTAKTPKTHPVRTNGKDRKFEV